MSDAMVSGGAHLLAPRDAYRLRYNSGFGGAEAKPRNPADPQYVPSGAMIDYWLPTNPDNVKIDIIDANGSVVRSMSSDAPPTPITDPKSSLAPVGTPRLTRNAGLNRVVWNFEAAGPWSSNARQNGRNGPMAPPGKYTVRMSYGSNAELKTLMVLIDPRLTKDGVTSDVLRNQFAYNIKARDLVTDVNSVVADLAAFKQRVPTGSSVRAKIADVENVLLTPPIRYSKPGLQSHIQYLYFETLGADQKVGEDAFERYRVLKTQLDSVKKQIAEIHGR
jgi:hypothetical protein